MFNMFGFNKAVDQTPNLPNLKNDNGGSEKVKTDSVQILKNLPNNINSLPLDSDFTLFGSKKIVDPDGYEYTRQFFAKSRKSRYDLGLMNNWENNINCKTVMSGAETKWDKKRLIDGKLSKLNEIGGTPILLNTESGDKISSVYFSLTNFFAKITEMGGIRAEIKIHFDHPYFEIGQPVGISFVENKEKVYHGVRIPYEKSSHSTSNHDEFLKFCAKILMVPIWEDSGEVVRQGSYRPGNMILMPKFVYLKIKDSAQVSISNTDRFDGISVKIFAKQGQSGKVIAFDRNVEQVKSLLDDLKINKTQMELIKCGDSCFLVKKTDRALLDTLDLIGERKLHTLPLVRYELKEEPKTDLLEAGVVVLSMNQNNSFTQYTHEILTFLLDGVNVLAYDNAEKGLSVGSNSSNGLKEAVEICGDYLMNEGYREEQIIFKGQCAGGLPSSEAAKTFTKSHVWVDQSPQNFSGVVQSVYTDYINKAAVNSKNDKANNSKVYGFLDATSKILGPVVAKLSVAVLPAFDVIKNLQFNQGEQIYTIGVPDEENQGGDKLVPVEHREQIRKFLEKQPKGLYLPMPGATHVTDWWLNPTVYNSIQEVLSKNSLKAQLFTEEKSLSVEQLIETLFEDLIGSPFNSTEAVPVDVMTYELLQAVAKGDLLAAEKYLYELSQTYLENEMKKLSKACLDIAKQTKNQKMIFHFIDKVRSESKGANSWFTSYLFEEDEGL